MASVELEAGGRAGGWAQKFTLSVDVEGGRLVLLPVSGIRLRDKARFMNQAPSLPFKEEMCVNFITIFSAWTVYMG